MHYDGNIPTNRNEIRQSTRTYGIAQEPRQHRNNMKKVPENEDRYVYT